MKPIDRTEAERLVQTYSDMILRLSWTYLKSTQDAEDICQTVFLKLLTGGMAFDSPEHEKAWIIRATANACKDALRASHRRCVGLEAVAETAAPEAPDSTVLEAVMALPKSTAKPCTCITTKDIPCAKSPPCLDRARPPFPHT